MENSVLRSHEFNSSYNSIVLANSIEINGIYLLLVIERLSIMNLVLFDFD